MRYSLIRLLPLSVLLVGLTSCASMFSSSHYPVTIESSPSEAQFSIADRDGRTVYQGVTPSTVELSASAGFFRSAQYTVTFQLDGYKELTLPIRSSIDGWYFANIAFGGPIGMLIIDPATGAMWRISDRYVQATLFQDRGKTALSVRHIDDLTEEERAHLELVQPGTEE